MLFEQFEAVYDFNRIFESVTGEIKDVEKDVDTIKKELEADDEIADDNDIKAAILLQAIEKDGDLDQLDLEAVKKEVKENNKNKVSGQPLNEDAGGIIHALELIGNFAGNADLVHFIANKVEKLTGKKMDEGKFKEKVLKIVEGLKTVTGLPAKALIKFFEWAAEKLGIKGDGAKAMDMVGRIIVLTFLFGIGIAHFPVLGTSALLWILSLTGLIGKSVEITHIVKELMHLLKDPEAFKKEASLSVDDVEAMIA